MSSGADDESVGVECGAVRRTSGTNPDGLCFVCILSPDYHIISLNASPAARKFPLGVNDIGVVNRSIWELIPELRERLLPVFEEVRQGNVMREAHNTRLQRGELSGCWDIYVLPSATGSSDASGPIAAAFIDVVKRQRLQQALIDTDTRYRRIIETTCEGVWMVDPSGITFYVNQQMADMLGYRIEEMAGRPFLDFVKNENKSEVERLWARRLRGIVEQFDFPLRRKDGVRIWGLITAMPILDECGRMVSAVAMVTDITQRKATEEALKKSERRLREAEELAHLGSYEFTVPGGEATWSDETFRITGRDVALGVPSADEYVLQMVHPDDRERVLAAVDESIKNKTRLSTEYRLVMPDGSIKYIQSVGQPKTNSAGEVDYFIGTILDITQRKQAEQERERQLMVLQRALLPALPRIGGDYNVASAFIPAAPGQEVGGDFYDIFRTEEGKTAIVVGDVSGKDIEAASMAAITRSTMRAFAYEIPSAADVLSHANMALCAQHNESGSFVTVFIAILDTPTGEMYYASAGHPPPALLRANGDFEFLMLGFPPLGIRQDLFYKQRRVFVGPGDKIIIFTDGISEARRGLEMLDLEGVERMIRQHNDAGPSELVEAIVEETKNWSLGHLADDIAILAIERKRPSGYNAAERQD